MWWLITESRLITHNKLCFLPEPILKTVMKNYNALTRLFLEVKKNYPIKTKRKVSKETICIHTRSALGNIKSLWGRLRTTIHKTQQKYEYMSLSAVMNGAEAVFRGKNSAFAHVWVNLLLGSKTELSNTPQLSTKTHKETEAGNPLPCCWIC